MEHSKHGTGTTSVVVHHQPGGKSTFSLGGGYGEDKDEKKMTGKIGAISTAPTAVPQAKAEEEEEKKDEEVKDGAKPATTSAVAAGTRPGGAVGATQAVQQQEVRQRQPPGGKSSGLW